MRSRKARLVAVLLASALFVAAAPGDALAASAAELSREANEALRKLLAAKPKAKQIADQAKAILVFPAMVKAGFMFGGQIGEGALLRKGGRTVGYYNSVAASYGLQAGAQTFGYALFFMNEAALESLNATAGFELGVGPSIVLVDEGAGMSHTTSTLTQDIYAFIFDQKGAMAGLGIQGSKITRITK